MEVEPWSAVLHVDDEPSSRILSAVFNLNPQEALVQVCQQGVALFVVFREALRRVFH